MVSYLPPPDRTTNTALWALPDNMKTILLPILTILLLTGLSLVRADDLYVGSVPVENQSPAARDGAFPRALMQVLEKLSGMRDLDQNQEVVDAVEYARSLVISFYYEQVESEPVTAGQASVNAQDQTLLAGEVCQGGY